MDVSAKRCAMAVVAAAMLLPVILSGAPSRAGVNPGLGNLLLFQAGEAGNRAPFVEQATNEVIDFSVFTDARDGSTDVRDWLLLGSGDFDGDGDGDYLWLHKWNGDVAVWLMRGTLIKSRPPVPGQAPRLADGSAAPAFIADMDQDGKSEVIWELDPLPPPKSRPDLFPFDDPNAPARYRYRQWRFDFSSSAPLAESSGATKGRIRSIGQFNGAGPLEMMTTYADAIGTVHTNIVFADGTSREGPPVSSAWQVKGVGDFDGNGTSDLLWQRSDTGEVFVWEMADATYVRSYSYYPAKNWTFGAIGDLDGNGVSDMVWRNRDGLLWIWSFKTAFQVHYGLKGTPQGNETPLIGTVATTGPLLYFTLAPYIFLPSNAQRCPVFDMTLADSAGASVTYHMPKDTSFTPTPMQGGVGTNGNKYCEYYIQHIGLADTYTVTTTLGGRAVAKVSTDATSRSFKICADVSMDGYSCPLVPNEPPKPTTTTQTIGFTLNIFGALKDYKPQTNEPIWYSSLFPALAGSGTLVDVGATGPINMPTKGNTTLDCNNPAKAISLATGQLLGPSGMMKVFGATTVSFTGASQIQLAACLLTLDSAQAPQTLPIQVTIQKNN